jgi:hypothetical protein
LTYAAMCCKLLHMTKTLTPPTRPPRVSVPVSGEVLEAFERLAAAGNMSVGGAIAGWLEDTLDAAQYVALTMEKARAAPKVVAREMHAYALGLADESGQLLRDIAARGKVDRAAAGMRQRDDSGAVSPSPPSSNTGGKVPRVNPKTKGV